MNLKNYLLASILGFGLIACNNDEVGEDNLQEGLPTYVNLSVYLPGTAPSRALPEDYNNDGTYEGNDLVETLDIYMRSADGTIEAKRFAGSGLATNGTLVSPSQPFRTTSGVKTVYVVINNPNPLGTSITSDDALVSIDGLAEVTTVNGVERDVITMTGKATNAVIEPDISEQSVLNGANHIAVEVERMASRVIVTTTASNEITDNDGNVIGTISDVTYSVAQGTNQIYFLPQTNYVSYGYDYVPELGEYEDQAAEYYDYSDLSNLDDAVPALPAAGDGYKSLPGKFLFENTHESGTLTTTGYRKGNTAYVLVRTIFTPAASAIADGGTLTNGTFYVGQADGLIYSNKQAALDAVQNQKVAVYLEGKMLYYAWLNPDNITRPLNSPVVRNNIYHINITGFSQIGQNWNPLYPEVPGTENPDPKPVNPDEPDTPIDPIDPLTPEETYMTVEVTALDWTVHSYGIEL
ncbi:MAG: Mfa1 family fimbria major subunit [Tannerellaceae bacterium]|nr:Mfa1 family fimbria major subunit [Tannerellaceae bacterium]